MSYMDCRANGGRQEKKNIEKKKKKKEISALGISFSDFTRSSVVWAIQNWLWENLLHAHVQYKPYFVEKEKYVHLPEI